MFWQTCVDVGHRSSKPDQVWPMLVEFGQRGQRLARLSQSLANIARFWPNLGSPEHVFDNVGHLFGNFGARRVSWGTIPGVLRATCPQRSANLIISAVTDGLYKAADIQTRAIGSRISFLEGHEATEARSCAAELDLKVPKQTKHQHSPCPPNMTPVPLEAAKARVRIPVDTGRMYTRPLSVVCPTLRSTHPCNVLPLSPSPLSLCARLCDACRKL